MSRLSEDYKFFNKIINTMREEKKIFCFVEKNQINPPYELWDSLQPVRKSLDGGIAIIDINTGKMLTTPSMSKKKITESFKKEFPNLDEKIILKKLKSSDDYSLNFKEVHQGRFKVFSE